MHRLQVLSLTAFMLMLPSRLPAQTPVDHDWDAQIVVCNDGKIGVDVVRAYRHPDYFRQEIREMSVCPVFFCAPFLCKDKYLPEFLKHQSHNIYPKTLRALEHQIHHGEWYKGD